MLQQRPPPPAFSTGWPGHQPSYSGVGRRSPPIQQPRPTLPWLQSRWPAPSTSAGALGRASTSRGLGLGTPPNPPAPERVTPVSLPCSVPCSGLEIPSSQPQDSDDITPGQCIGLATPDRSQQSGTPVDGQQQEAPGTEASDGARLISGGELKSYLQSTVQAALDKQKMDWDSRNSAYMQEVRGFLHQHDQRMASLESQSLSNAGECLLFFWKTDK